MAMSKQEIFDRVATHLLKQAKRAQGYNTPGCLYRGAYGTKCAVGALVEDRYYDEDMEGRKVGAIEVRGALHKSGVLSGDLMYDHQLINLLEDLQHLHDRNEPEHWQSGLAVVANRHHLHYAGHAKRDMPALTVMDECNFMSATFEVHVDPVTGWRTPIYTKVSAELYHPAFHDDAEKAQRLALFETLEALKKAKMVERKSLTAPEDMLV